MMKSDIHPPRTGLNADPILYGVAAGLAELFPPVLAPLPPRTEREGSDDRDGEREGHGED